ncbi:MAG TPA: cation acetate symporter [Candidatus Baltobacteraceae bacterium]|jgi:cation/acetate symporter
MSPTVVMFVVFVAITLVITYFASGRSKTSRGFYSAHRRISGFQNGWAVAGDYMSAASFLGITGLIAFFGFDGFMYSVGWLVAYLTVLLLVAEPLRNTGKYTMADVISFRNRGRGVRAIAAISTLIITLFYMIAQMVGAGSLVNALIPGFSFNTAIIVVGVLMLVYVTVGGMLATTWVQTIKAGLLLGASALLSVLVLSHYHFSLGDFFAAAANAHGAVGAGTTKSLLQPGLFFSGRWGALDLLSLGIALVLGTAGLPHILMRFYTVPSAKAARTSVAWAMVLIGIFYLLTTFMGFGAATLVGQARIGPHVGSGEAIRYIAHHPAQAPALNADLQRDGYIVPVKNDNLAAIVLAQSLGGDLFLAFIAAVAFATILAVVAGLTIAASSAFAHDIWWTLVRNGEGDEVEQLQVARMTAAVVAVISIVLAIWLKNLNVAFLVGLAFAVAASANVPAIILTLAWKRFNRAGTISGMIAGLVSSLALIAIGPAVMGVDPADAVVRHLIQAPPIFPLANPGLVSVPLGFIAAVVGTLLSRDPESEALYAQLEVRATTGLGAEL